jgi:Flp pilus assembly protein TadG
MVSTVLIPVVGLAIDGGRGYLVRLKLSSAVDGGALAAARLLGTGNDQTAQVNNAVATVKLFVSANFPAQFFGASLAGDPDVCVDPGSDNTDPCKVSNGASGVSTFKVRTVVVNASAQMPTLFMGILGMPTVTVNAKGVASRRDVRVVMVMDRSSSMAGFYTGTGQNPPSIQDIALKFVNGFSGASKGGRDEVGLVVYGGSGIIAYPPRVLTADYSDYTKFSPPDANFGVSTAIPQYIGEMKGGSNTGTAEALYLAYSMLRADSNTNSELANKLNVIVLFTDGIPNGITTFANDPTAGITQPMKTACTDKTLGSWTSSPLVVGTNTNMIGWLSQWGGNKSTDSTSAPHGLFPPMMYYASGYTGTGSDIDLYMKNPDADNKTQATPPTDKQISQMTGCSGEDPMLTTMTKIPDRDLYGNYTDLAFGKIPAVGGLTPPLSGGQPIYRLGSLYNTSTQCNKVDFAANSPTNACQIGLASWNAAAHQAWKIWNQIVWDKTTQANIPDPGKYLASPVIFTIGFNSGKADDQPDMTLLQMIANDPTSPVSFSNRINGQAFYAKDPNAVDNAFQQISSQILRLSQ